MSVYFPRAESNENNFTIPCFVTSTDWLNVNRSDDGGFAFRTCVDGIDHKVAVCLTRKDIEDMLEWMGL